jgi:uncharacterized protein
MAKDYSDMENSNASANASIHDISSPERRKLLQGSAGLAVAGLLGGCATAGGAGTGSFVSAIPKAAQRAPKVAFKSVPVGIGDKFVVPEGYTATPIAAWGEPVGIPGNMPAYKSDATNTAADQDVQMGMHHDGIHFYAINNSSSHGLLVSNHEYTDDGLLHPKGFANWSAENVRKAQAGHGVSVIEVKLENGKWNMVRPSKYARRFTSYSPFSVAGPAAGHAMMKTAADPAGTTVLGTLNNCASGMTPWGTYLSGEENWAFYFDAGDKLNDHEKRWGLRPKSTYRWAEFDERFNSQKHPNEPNRFGWVVEIDPMDPTSTPVKRTALGRAAHEGAWVAVTKDGRAVVYSGEDARNEYIYKFVSRERIAAGGAKANKTLLDFGTLFVARFDADGTGVWLPMVHGQGPLTAANGFADQGEVVIKARQAADILRGTKMDRPEWLAIDPFNGEVYCTLTNNSARGTAAIAVDAANPRANNAFGNIIRWKEAPDFDGTSFAWNHFVLAGDPSLPRADAKGNVKGDLFACPDGIAFDQFGTFWVQTDAHATQMYKGEFANIGNNQTLAYDPSTGAFKRFLTSPINSEVTGITWTPDGTTMFVNVQHPGENASDRSDPAKPDQFSNWPDGIPGRRPRSATVVVRKNDGGIIGS